MIGSTAFPGGVSLSAIDLVSLGLQLLLLVVILDTEASDDS